MPKRTHSLRIKGYRGSLEELGRDIMRLRYDAVLSVVYGMALEVYSQMQNNAARGNKKLARLLCAVYIGLASTRHALQLVWSFCRTQMQKELRKTSEVKEGQIYGY